ncbi:34889_t:CDS:2 [Gigaspora margarita]|uniref:34889_t:CDS:1 n=1 Tax=Gigaspora margarita TaxID=4874 RepID=A0ABN7UR35_GIGMA|nr:34889_t:CDS:2 [Gigaspora margarita]
MYNLLFKYRRIPRNKALQKKPKNPSKLLLEDDVLVFRDKGVENEDRGEDGGEDRDEDKNESEDESQTNRL